MPTVFESRPETLALVELLAATPPGQLLTFERLGAVAGLDVRRHLHLFTSARRIAEREHGVVYRNERAIGYRRLSTDEIPAVEVRAADHQRSVARQTIQTLTRGVERANDIPTQTQLRLNAGLARQGIIARLAARRTLTPIIQAGELQSPPEIAQRLLDRARQRPPKRRSA